MKKNILFLTITLLLISFSVQSLARYNPAWKWRTVRTENFTVYYPEGHETAAQRILSLSSEIHDDVTGYLGINPRRCPIVLNPGTDIFNGFYSPFPNRISLFETPLYTVKGFGNNSDIIDLVYTHEYTHYVHVTTRLGWYGFLSRVMGEALAITNIFSPGWIIEGITTNTETMFTDGGRGRCSLFRGKMMSFTEGEGLWNLSSAGTFPPYTPPADRIYLSGYYMVEYMNRTYGEDSVPNLNRYQARHPLGGTGKAIKNVIKESPKKFYSEFRTDFEVNTENQKNRVLADKLPSGKVILSEPIDDFRSHFWTDEGTIKVLRRGYDKKTAVIEINPDSGEIVEEKNAGILYNLLPVRNTPDGRLVFGEIFFHPLGNGELDVTDLVIFDAETKEHLRLTDDQHIYSADLSPDGKTFVAACRNGMWIDLILLDSDGSNIRTLISKPGVYFEAPCWSPDGSTIAAAFKVGQKTDIVIINPETGELSTLFGTDIHEDNEPSFSPDNRWVVFSSNRSGIWNIHAWDMVEKKLYQLSSVFYAASEPRISPDGRTLSFFSMYRGVNRLCSMPFEPQAGRIIPVEDGGAVDEPDLDRLQPDIKFQSNGIPVWEAYKPMVHAPYAESDEKGGKFGIFCMGADPIGLTAYNAQILYGIESERPGYDVTIINKSFWPAINVRIYDSAEEHNTLSGGEDFWFRERGVKLSLGLDVLHRNVPSKITSSYVIGTHFRGFDGLNDHRIERKRDQAFGVFSGIDLKHIPDFARRDVVPQWAQMLYISHENGFSKLGGEITGHNTIVSAKQYIPSPVKHHGFELTFAHQSQGGYLHYEKYRCIPRGYSQDDSEGNLNMRKNLMMSLEYHFPLWYTDRGIGLILYHLNLLKGSFFVDYGAGWNRSFDIDSWMDKARTSVGATLTIKSSVLSWLPIEAGISAGYKVRDKEKFAHIILRIDMDMFNNRQVFYDYF